MIFNTFIDFEHDFFFIFHLSGWRVPPSGEEGRSPWKAFTVENGVWTGSDGLSGRLFGTPAVRSGLSAWYPSAGVRLDQNGRISYDIHLWASTASEQSAFRFHSDPGRVAPVSVISRSRGNSVRCVRE